jgi:hypothetical protein
MTAERFDIAANTVSFSDTASAGGGGYVVQGGTVSVTIDAPTEDVVLISGPVGPVGPSGPSYEGVAWWTGEGDPIGIVGSKPGDYYINTLNGVIYKLGD